MKATSIVNGIQQQANGDAQIIHLNLLGRTGRQVAAAYGIKVIPATIVVDSSGNTLYRRNGFPEEEKILQIMDG